MEIKPFRALRYDKQIVGDAGNCIAPPYDVIDELQQQRLYQKSRYNIVRLIKGKTEPSDTATDNQYTRAAEYLRQWIQQGVLKQDPTGAIYAYVQDFQLDKASFQRFSFIALAKLEEFGKTVRPHEETLHKPQIDRLNLKLATAAKFGLVFMLYEDPQYTADNIIQKTIAIEPLLDFSDEEKVRHRLFAINAARPIHAITEMMKDKFCIIADGHHRYSTGLSYYKETRNPAAAYQMAAFVNSHHPGLVVLATHRLVSNLQNFDLPTFLQQLREDFDVTDYPFDSQQAKALAEQKMLDHLRAEHQKNRNAFGIYSKAGAFHLAVLRNKCIMDSVIPNKSRAWRALDVAVLHKLILEKLLAIDEEKLAEGTNLEYVKDTPNAVQQSIRRVDTGEVQIAFFMNPLKLQQLKRVTDAGERMPQKSTYFYPKIYSGLTINKF